MSLQGCPRHKERLHMQQINHTAEALGMSPQAIALPADGLPEARASSRPSEKSQRPRDRVCSQKQGVGHGISLPDARRSPIVAGLRPPHKNSPTAPSRTRKLRSIFSGEVHMLRSVYDIDRMIAPDTSRLAADVIVIPRSCLLHHPIHCCRTLMDLSDTVDCQCNRAYARWSWFFPHRYAR